MERRSANGLGLVAIGAWSLLALLGAQVRRVPPFETLAATFAIATSIGLLFDRRRTVRDDRAPLRERVVAVSLGVFGLFAFHALYFAALALAPPIEVSLV